MYKRVIRSVAIIPKRSSGYSLQQCCSFQSLVSTDWLADQLAQTKANAKLRVLHAVLRHDDFSQCHIPGALCFNISSCSNTGSPYPNMLPLSEQFEKYVNENIYAGNDDHIVIYDSNCAAPSLYPGARAWFMFKVFGHVKVSLLNGGLFKWLKEGRPTETTSTKSIGCQSKNFKAKYQPDMVVAFEEVLKNVKSPVFQLVDTRPTSNFKGIQGHMPNAINVSYDSFVDKDSNLVVGESQLNEIFKKAEIDLQRPLITSCGSGITACAAIFAAHLCGKNDTKLYDGSWSEWAKRVDGGLIIKD